MMARRALADMDAWMKAEGMEDASAPPFSCGAAPAGIFRP
jgi:hypothetical protein